MTTIDEKIDYICNTARTLSLSDKTSIAKMIQKRDKNLINENPDAIRVPMNHMPPDLVDQIYSWLQNKKN
jgi:hypothetical protein